MKRLFRIVLVLVITVLVVRWLWPDGVDIEPGSVLVVDVGGGYVEGAQPPLLARLMGEREKPLGALLGPLALARRDDRLAGVVLRIRGLEVGWAKAQEIRDAIQRLSAAGRKTVAHLEIESFSANLEYYVASAADEVVVGPASRAALVGLAGEYLFLGGLFEKLGIDFEVERIGRFKTAADTLAGREMSDAHREMAEALLDSLDAQFVGGIASARGLNEEFVRRAIDSAPAAPDELLGWKLVDAVASFEDVPARIGDGPVVEARDYAQIDPASAGFAPAATLAVIYGSGGVVTGEGRSTPTGNRVLASETISKALEAAAESDEVEAILFRIDSPGGSALASDLVWEAVGRAQQAGKPVIASFSDVAASGGYYVAAGADAIVAQPGTLTGSIGVFVLRPVLGQALGKLGIGVETLTRGAYADLQLASQPLSPSSRERLRAEVKSVYDLFVERVAAGRPLDAEGVDAVARGRVWTGAQAAERGLVDELGGLRTAVSRALVLTGHDADADVTLMPFPRPRSVPEQLAEALGLAVRSAAQAPLAPLPEWTARLEPWLRAARGREISALLPFPIAVR